MLSVPLSRFRRPGRGAGAESPREGEPGPGQPRAAPEGAAEGAGLSAPAAVLSLPHWLARPPLRRAIGSARATPAFRGRGRSGARAPIGPRAAAAGAARPPLAGGARRGRGPAERGVTPPDARAAG